MSKRVYIFLFLFIFAGSSYANERVILKVFHAGSLSVPFSVMEKSFEKKYPYIDVQREVSGSVRAVRKVTDLHKVCDVIAVADYSLIPKMMFGRYTGYVKLFARNELVLCYTKGSKYKDKINKKNWYKILNKKMVRWGFSNPNDDPCGYRTILLLGLAKLYYKENILSILKENMTGILWKEEDNKIHFFVSKRFGPKKRKIIIRPKEVDLLGLLESGSIDYLFIYRSVAMQHKLRFIEFPEKINLGSLRSISFYKKAKITLSNKKSIIGKPIIYGISVLKVSQHRKEAKMWEEFVTGKEGKAILEKCHQIPIYPAKEIKCKKIF